MWRAESRGRGRGWGKNWEVDKKTSILSYLNIFLFLFSCFPQLDFSFPLASPQFPTSHGLRSKPTFKALLKNIASTDCFQFFHWMLNSQGLFSWSLNLDLLPQNIEVKSFSRQVFTKYESLKRCHHSTCSDFQHVLANVRICKWLCMGQQGRH